ncbi:MAG TPA: ribosome-associated translation inhibitor RaiA [Terriglobia bacterium]|nr:ribosome-associated translation inhibitor RaiA [Terriglobia bacterium]
MNIEYTGRQIEVTPDLRQYAEERLQKLNRVLRDRSSIHVILEAAKHRRTAEVTVKWRDQTLVGFEETTDPRSSINGAIDKLEKQAVRLLQRRWTRKRRPGPTSALTLNVMRMEQAAGEAAAAVATERIPIKPLSVDEAIATLEADSKDLVAFRNTETDRVNIVYWRRDGRLVLIEPES